VSKPKSETLRRLRVGDLRRVLRHRYGPTLPDDDAGRDDLGFLLEAISLDPKAPAEKMACEIEVIAPWLPTIEAKQLIGDLMNLPLHWRNRPAKEIGERLRLTNVEREGLRAWSIAPVDITADELREQRKAKKRARDRKRYKHTRADYEAKSKSKLKPWEAEGVSRRTWYRRRGTSQRSAILDTKRAPVPTAVGPAGGALGLRRDEPETKRPEPNECRPSSTARALVPHGSSTADGLVSPPRFVGVSGYRFCDPHIEVS
jgi:hypothetical protein